MIDQGFSYKNNAAMKPIVASRMRAELEKASPEKKRAVKAYLDSKGYDPKDFGINPREFG